MQFKWINANPWQQYRPDCTVRAFCLALGKSYESICKKLKVKCIPGFGIPKKTADDSEGAVSIDQIFKSFKNEIEAFDEDLRYISYFWASKSTKYRQKKKGYDPDEGKTIEQTAKDLPKGRYVFIVRPTSSQEKAGTGEWHCTYANLAKDVLFDMEDYRKNEIVYGWIRLKPSSYSKASVSDPDSRAAELYRIYCEGKDWGEAVPSIFSKKEFQAWKEAQKNQAGGKEAAELRGVSLYRSLKKAEADFS